MAERLAIKGVGDGLLVSLPQEDADNAFEALIEAIDDRSDFFRSARLALDVQDLALGAAELGKWRAALAEREVTLWAMLSTSSVTQSAAADLGLDRDLKNAHEAWSADEVPFDTSLPGEDAVLVRRTLRSGNHVRHPGHVVIIGDVNPGAEIVAGGHVIVWGHLRGMVHAGAAGDEQATIRALDLSPTQLRIAGHIALSPERKEATEPEVARVREGQLVAEAWDHDHTSPQSRGV